MHFIGLLIGVLFTAYAIAKAGRPVTVWGWASYLCLILACWLSIESLALVAIGISLMAYEIKIMGEKNAAVFLEESLKAAGELLDEHEKNKPTT